MLFSCNNSRLEQSDTLISKVEYLKRTQQKRLICKFICKTFMTGADDLLYNP